MTKILAVLLAFALPVLAQYGPLYNSASTIVSTAKLGVAVVTTPKLAADAVAESKILGASVTTSKLGNGSVTTSKLGSDLAMPGAVSIDGTTFQVDSANNRVGIVTASPLTVLDVNGGATIRGQATFTSSVTVNATTALAADFAGPVEVGAITSTGTANLDGATTVSALFRVTNALAANSEFDSSNATEGGIRIENTSTGGEDWLIYSVGANGSQGQPAGSLFIYALDAAARRFAIDNSGNIVMGSAGTVSTFTATGFWQMPTRTKAQIDTLDPTIAGEPVYCSNCNYTCVSTGTAAAQFGRIGAETTTGCGSGS